MQKGTPVIFVQICMEFAPVSWAVPMLNKISRTTPATGYKWSRDPRGPALLGGLDFWLCQNRKVVLAPHLLTWHLLKLERFYFRNEHHTLKK